MKNSEAPKIIGKGRWNENTTWEFVISPELPPLELCTAICCILSHQEKLFLVKNNRGWELPAGHIELGETVEQAILREVREEAGVAINPPTIFGHKKLTSLQPVPRKDNPHLYYPFPHAYVIFAFANAESVAEEPYHADIYDKKLATYHEALETLSDTSQYHDILSFLLAQQLLKVAL